ncbi:MAG: sugar kinase [Elusimicrobiota bacterium]
MLISRAPVRITLGGGGTDLASYYSKHGGFLISGAINKYMYLCAHATFNPAIIRLSYSETEYLTDPYKVRHRIFREALRMQGIKKGIELVSVADVPPNCGLGSSSAFTVALLNALHAHQRRYITQAQLAEKACFIEIDMLKEPIGKQDQYASAFGGITCLTFEKNGDVRAEPLRLNAADAIEMESRIMLFYTGIERRASEILKEQDAKAKANDQRVTESLHAIKQIGLTTRKLLESGRLDDFGDLLNEHWQTKKRLSVKVSNAFIDECYADALKHGALGGKLMGAGGGGFFLFYCPKNKGRLIKAMERHGLKLMPFRFDLSGAKIVADLSTS